MKLINHWQFSYFCTHSCHGLRHEQSLHPLEHNGSKGLLCRWELKLLFPILVEGRKGLWDKSPGLFWDFRAQYKKTLSLWLHLLLFRTLQKCRALNSTIFNLKCEPMPPVFQKVSVSHMNGEILGIVKEMCTLCTPAFYVLGFTGKREFYIYGPPRGHCCCCRMCGKVTFKICLPDRVTEVGEITKHWGGIMKEGFSSADTFGITFPIGLDSRLKAVLIGAVFLVVRREPRFNFGDLIYISMVFNASTFYADCFYYSSRISYILRIVVAERKSVPWTESRFVLQPNLYISSL